METTRGTIHADKVALAVAGNSSHCQPWPGCAFRSKATYSKPLYQEGVKPLVHHVVTFGAGHFYINRLELPDRQRVRGIAARRQSARGVRGRARRSTTRRCRRSRCSSTCPRRRSCCRRRARRRACASSRRRSRCRSPATRRSAPRTSFARSLQAGDRVTLEMRAGVIPVDADGDVWTLTANAPRHRAAVRRRARSSRAMLGLPASDLDAAREPLWVDTGSEQLVDSARVVRRGAPRAAVGGAAARARQQRASARWRTCSRAKASACSPASSSPSTARSIEDPGTGSACANLGGWLLATGAPLPQRAVDRPGRGRRPPLPARAARRRRPVDPRVRPRDRDRPRDDHAVAFARRRRHPVHFA